MSDKESSSEPKDRLDRALMRRNLVGTRSRAAQMISAGQVALNGVVVTKAAALVSADDEIECLTPASPWVSRAAYKLVGALEAFSDITVTGKHCLDAGASTGGFTQVLLHEGAADVTAIDVGSEQLVDQLRHDPRVHSYEGLNLRHLKPGDLTDPFDLLVADLSFISLTKVMANIASVVASHGDAVLLVKPQFEVGKGNLSKAGVVTSTQLRNTALENVIASAREHRLIPQASVESPLLGQNGNIEYCLHLIRAGT